MPRLDNSDRKSHDEKSSTGASSIEVKEDIVGTQIQDASQKLIKSILENDRKKCHAYGIVGMGGIGKTTLARRIFNDSKIAENFPLRVWLYVSKNYSGAKLLKELIRSIGGKVEESESITELCDKLVPLLVNRFFIVLDDVWSRTVWENLLRNPLLNAQARGKVLITTRDGDVATSFEADIHRVDKMNAASGWTLLCRNVFGEEEGEDMARLRDTGRRIVEKCDGLPLAIKAIAGVLKEKRSNSEWEDILRSDQWQVHKRLQNDLPTALYLSFNDLPSHLKQCFLYCSLYPPKVKIDSEDLVRLWIAEGFVKRERGRALEDIALGYYWALVRRNLLQLDFDVIDGRLCNVHDLLRALAQSLLEEEAVCISDSEVWGEIQSKRIRRLSVVHVGEKVMLQYGAKSQRCLRTLIVFPDPRTRSFEENIFERVKSLRVLWLNDCDIETIPDSIGNLLHLRYLDLDRTKVKEIPKSIGKLLYLQTLNLCECESLRALPNTVTKLVSLRCLRLEGTPLSHMPKGISKLKNLYHLGGFIVGCGKGCELDELQSLPSLRYLCVVKFERATTGVSVAHMSSLKTLYLYQSIDENRLASRDGDNAGIQKVKNIYNQLSPPKSIKYLNIDSISTEDFPAWIMTQTLGDQFPDLVYIFLHNFRLCKQFPPLYLLPQLKFISIKKGDAVVNIGPEFLGPLKTGATSFPKLEQLEFVEMDNWEDWSSNGKSAVDSKLLPELKKLYIIDCLKLRALPSCLRLASKFQSLFLINVHSLREVIDLPFLETLEVRYAANLERISNHPSLKHLDVRDCPTLMEVDNVDALEHLKVFCRSDTLPVWLPELLSRGESAHPQCQSLTDFLLKCPLSLLSNFVKGGSYWRIIQQIPEVRIEAIDNSGYIFYAKDSQSYETNVSCS